MQITGTTSTGYDFSISDKIFNDYRFILAFKKSKDKNKRFLSNY